MSFAEKHRPQLFEEIIGQTEPVRWCIHQAAQRIPRSVVISGASGSGKTSLARIFAKALNCDSRRENSSPCCTCPECEAFDEETSAYTILLNCSRHGGIETIKHVLEICRSQPHGGKKWAVLLDEAHETSPKSLTALHDALERSIASGVFILVTTLAERLGPAILSRCQRLELQPVRHDASVTRLREVCEAEGICFEDGALELIAEHSRGNTRALVNTLEHASEFGDVTEAAIRRLFKLDSAGPLVSYFRSLLTGQPLMAQMKIIDSWDCEPSRKEEALQAALVHTFLNGVQRFRWANREMDAIAPADREWIVDQVSRRAAAMSVPVRRFWEEAMMFWEPGPAPATKTSLGLKLIRFDSLLNPPPSSEPAREPPHHKKGDLGRAAGRGPVGVQSGPGTSPPDAIGSGDLPRRPQSLSKEQAQELWDAASFLAKEYGELLNTRVSLSHEILGARSSVSPSKLVSDLTHQLSSRVAYWSQAERNADPPASHFHWLYVHEHQELVGHRTHLVAHIPAQFSLRAQSWVLRRFLPKRFGLPLPHGGVRMKVCRIEDPRKRVWLHAHLVRILCRGLDPKITARCASDARIPLIDLLGVPKRLRCSSGEIECVQRFGVSESINRGVRENAVAERLGAFSAFADRAWSHLDTGWELDEFRDRCREKDERHAAEAAIWARWPRGGSKLQDSAREAALVKLRASWHRSPPRKA